MNTDTIVCVWSINQELKRRKYKIEDSHPPPWQLSGDPGHGLRETWPLGQGFSQPSQHLYSGIAQHPDPANIRQRANETVTLQSTSRKTTFQSGLKWEVVSHEGYYPSWETTSHLGPPWDCQINRFWKDYASKMRQFGWCGHAFKVCINMIEGNTLSNLYMYNVGSLTSDTNYESQSIVAWPLINKWKFLEANYGLDEFEQHRKTKQTHSPLLQTVMLWGTVCEAMPWCISDQNDQLLFDNHSCPERKQMKHL